MQRTDVYRLYDFSDKLRNNLAGQNSIKILTLSVMMKKEVTLNFLKRIEERRQKHKRETILQLRLSTIIYSR